MQQPEKSTRTTFPLKAHFIPSDPDAYDLVTHPIESVASQFWDVAALAYILQVLHECAYGEGTEVSAHEVGRVARMMVDLQNEAMGHLETLLTQVKVPPDLFQVAE